MGYRPSAPNFKLKGVALVVLCTVVLYTNVMWNSMLPQTLGFEHSISVADWQPLCYVAQPVRCLLDRNADVFVLPTPRKIRQESMKSLLQTLVHWSACKLSRFANRRNQCWRMLWATVEAKWSLRVTVTTYSVERSVITRIYMKAFDFVRVTGVIISAAAWWSFVPTMKHFNSAVSFSISSLLAAQVWQTST